MTERSGNFGLQGFVAVIEAQSLRKEHISAAEG